MQTHSYKPFPSKILSGKSNFAKDGRIYSTFAIAGTLEKLYESLENELKLRTEENNSRVESTITSEEVEDEGIEEELEDAEFQESEQSSKVKKPRIDK